MCPSSLKKCVLQQCSDLHISRSDQGKCGNIKYDRVFVTQSKWEQDTEISFSFSPSGKTQARKEEVKIFMADELIIK